MFSQSTSYFAIYQPCNLHKHGGHHNGSVSLFVSHNRCLFAKLIEVIFPIGWHVSSVIRLLLLMYFACHCCSNIHSQTKIHSQPYLGNSAGGFVNTSQSNSISITDRYRVDCISDDPLKIIQCWWSKACVVKLISPMIDWRCNISVCGAQLVLSRPTV